MNAPRPNGSLHPNGRGSNDIVIREGEVPCCHQVPVQGKGKNLLVESMAGKKSLGVKRNPDDLRSVEALKEGENVEDRSLDLVDPEIQKNKINEVAEAWSKPKPIKISFNRYQVEFLEDDIAVKLNADMEEKNSQILKNSVVIKVLGNNVPFSICSTELRRQWRKFGGFHLKSIGMNWILCSFHKSEVVEEVLNGGPWYVNGSIVGMDRWSAAFDPNTFKGVSTPVWIRLLCPPLYCWDEDNIARIASCLGPPMYIDDNTFRWGKWEIARCGRVGHNRDICPKNVAIGLQNQDLKEMELVNDNSEKVVPDSKTSMISSEYGPWIYVHFKNKRGNKEIKMMNEDTIAGHNVLVPNISSETENHVGKNNSDNVLTNRFAMLSDSIEEECMQNHAEIDKTDVRGWESLDANISNNGLGSHSGAAKIKRSKELRSLGPVELDYKKKKRGARKKEASLYLKDIVRDQIVYFIGLMKTKLSSIDRRDVDYLIGKEWEYFHYPAVGISGGILVLWNRNLVSFDIMEASSQAIVGSLSVPSLGTWKVSTVYGSRCCKERGSLWNQLQDCMEDSIPSIIGGDFNCIINKEEMRGGKRFLFSEGLREKKSFMVNSDFHDIGSMGPRFTWCNNKEGTSWIWERLDRCILNLDAIQKLPVATIKHLARVVSDHSPIVLNMRNKMQCKAKIFKFEDTWRSYPAAKSIVYNSWKKNDYGDEYIIIQRKLNRTLKALFFWNRNKCKDLNLLKEKLKREIHDIQNKEYLDDNWSVDDLFVLRKKVHELNITLRRLSTWWNQRAKVRWHEEGDTNSRFFQNFASARRNGNRINQVKDEFNMIQVEEDQIEKVFSKFFEKKWKYRECELTGWPLVDESQKVNDEDMLILNEEFSVNELQLSVFQQGNNKAPGIDGVTTSFYKTYWSIVWETLWSAVNRPISLCQTNYKIVASMLVNRLKKVIGKMVSEEQAAFITGRSISEHSLLAQEVLHKFKLSKNKKGLMAIKLDMEHAYDSMGRITLRQALKWYGFPTMFSNFLMECVVDVRFSIIINGRNPKWICAQSGFRLGCPLPPYLFILCSQLISNSLE
ncbi:uncharacterized protein LOC110103861 [Dendrobium catenatum]|uniref:uncharacterized protein LOC110103861 n=1 Tax=Dendrobium catenatum TaxID=906689 RepID=UPI0010A038A1|nr:uncharacterized protein LOC110103861 [Dendrobium catenatum]